MLVIVFAVSLVLDAKRTRFTAVTRFVAYVPGAWWAPGRPGLLWLFMFTPAVSRSGS
jgi:hypothetical protein